MKKSFDAVNWMQKRRTEIDEEDWQLSWEENRQKTRGFLEKDRLWLKLKNRLVEPSSPSWRGSSRQYSEVDEKKLGVAERKD